MNLAAAFRIRRGERVAFTGAGGKTSALALLGHELASAGWRVIATTTTRIAQAERELFPAAFDRAAPLGTLQAAFETHRLVFIYDHLENAKAIGLTPEMASALADRWDADALLIEADGARGRLLKGPLAHEPVIPPDVTLVVPVAHLGALGGTPDETRVYNPAWFAVRYDPLTAWRSPWLEEALTLPDAGLKGVPPGARIMPLLNGAAGVTLPLRARLLAERIIRVGRIEGAVIAQLNYRTGEATVHEARRPVAAVVLAAGMSRRMGQPKVLLPWVGERTILDQILWALKEAGIQQVVVVTGNHAEQVTAIAHRWGARAAFNPRYETTDMAESLKTGLSALTSPAAAALIVLGDQPRLQPSVVRRVVDVYASTGKMLAAPSYHMRRGHPILVDRALWPELLALPEDAAPRDVINAHGAEIAYVAVETDSVLRDVDTPEDYAAERRAAHERSS